MKNNLKKITVLYFGTYDPEYSRNWVLIEGLRRKGVDVIECRDDSTGLKKFWRLFLKLHRVKDDYDVVVIGFFSPLIVPLAKLITRKPVIFDPLVLLYDSNVLDRKVVESKSLRALYYWCLDWLTLHLADMVLFDTQENIKYASKEYRVRPEKFRKIFIGTREDIYHPIDKKANEKNFLVEFHGIFNPLQGVEFIVRAAKKLESYADIRFAIIGNGNIKGRLLQLARDLRIKNIDFTEPVSQEELAQKITEADICLGIFGVSDKTRRVIPNKVYECAAMRKPVISADTPAIRELFSDDDLMLIKIADANAIADAILKLKNDESFREKLADSAYYKLKSKASVEILGSEFKNIIQDLIKPK